MALTGRFIRSSYAAFSFVKIRTIPTMGKIITAERLSTCERLMGHKTSVVPLAAPEIVIISQVESLLLYFPHQMHTPHFST